MKPIHQWLEEYGESHQNPINILIHKICVPAIVFSILGMLWHIDLPGTGGRFNLTSLVIAVCITYYFALSRSLAVGMVLLSGVGIAGISWLDANLSHPLWQVSLGVFVIAWIFQFIGHKIEGKKPSFFEDLVFLLIGPLWTISFLYRRFNISY